MRATPPMGVSGVPVAGPGALTPFNSAYGMEALATDEDGKPFGNLIASAEAAMEEKDALKSVAAEAAAKPPPPPPPKVEEAKAEAEERRQEAIEERKLAKERRAAKEMGMTLGEYDKWRNEHQEFDADWDEDEIDWDEVDFSNASPELFDAFLAIMPQVESARLQREGPPKEGHHGSGVASGTGSRRAMSPQLAEVRSQSERIMMRHGSPTQTISPERQREIQRERRNSPEAKDRRKSRQKDEIAKIKAQAAAQAAKDYSPHTRPLGLIPEANALNQRNQERDSKEGGGGKGKQVGFQYPPPPPPKQLVAS